LAAKSEVEYTKPDVAMRQFVRNSSSALPVDLNVFYFIYPYPNVVVIRDVVMLAKRGRFDKVGMFSMLKYFPVAFVVANLNEYEGLPSLSAHCPLSLDAEVQLSLPLGIPRAHNWPEIVDDGNMLAGGGASGHSSISALPRGTNPRG
jgi:hypothetical protein